MARRRSTTAASTSSATARIPACPALSAGTGAEQLSERLTGFRRGHSWGGEDVDDDAGLGRKKGRAIKNDDLQLRTAGILGLEHCFGVFVLDRVEQRPADLPKLDRELISTDSAIKMKRHAEDVTATHRIGRQINASNPWNMRCEVANQVRLHERLNTTRYGKDIRSISIVFNHDTDIAEHPNHLSTGSREVLDREIAQRFGS